MGNFLGLSSFTRQGEKPLTPYSLWFHPEYTWVDLFMSLFMSFILPLRKLNQYSPSNDPKSLEFVKKMRNTLEALCKLGLKGDALVEWEKVSGSPIAEHRIELQQNPAILKDWKIYEKPVESYGAGTIHLHLFFPSSLIPNLKAPEEKTEVGSRHLEAFDVSRLPHDIPVVLAFHGGGQIIGTPYDVFQVNLMLTLTKKSKNAFVMVTSSYSLSPDHPFPASTMDAMTSISFMLKTFPERRLHVCGISAGGHVALGATMEAARQFPGRIASLLVYSPMLDPKADSRSYYLNSVSSIGCPTSFLRWSWRAFLEMTEEAEERRPADEEDTSPEAIFQRDSNRTLWEQSKWRKTTLERLACPLINMPSNLGAHDSPSVIVVTNRGDPLHDDGVALVEKLQDAKARVQHIDAGGMHCSGNMDSATEEALLTAWNSAIK